MRTLLATILMLILAAAAAAQSSPAPIDASVVRLFPADSSVLFGFDWRRTLDSAGGQELRNKLATTQTSSFFPMLGTLQKAFLEDVDAIFFAASANNLVTSGSNGPFLAVVKGRFNRPKLRSWIQGKAEMHRGVELITPTGAKPPTLRVAVADPTTLLFGDRAQVIAALNRAAAAPSLRLSGRILDRAAELAGRHQLWIVMDVPPNASKKTSDPSAMFLSELNGFDLGSSFTRGFDLQANLWAKSETAAQSLLSTVQTMLASVVLQQGKPPELQEFADKVAFRRDGSAVSISLTLNESELKTLQELQARYKSTAPVTVGSRMPAPTPKRADPSQPRTIRIIGLDKGPMEVPVPAAQK